MKARETETTVHLVLRAQDGEREALNRLFERYLPRVRRIVALRLRRPLSPDGDLGELEDMVQDSLLKACESLDTFRVQSDGTFCNWMSTCAQAAIADSFRRARAKKRGSGRVLRFADLPSASLSSSIFAGDAPMPIEIAKARELEERLEAAMLGMEEHQREVIILRQLCGMSYAEIATEMGFEKEATVRQVCARALGKLKKLVGA